MTSHLNLHLKSLIEEASLELPEVTQRRMFGAEGFLFRGTSFAMAWDGRIVLKVPDAVVTQKLLALEGSEPWRPAAHMKPMGAWVVVSEELHDDLEALRPWVEHAHRLVASLPPKVPKAAKGPKKPAAKKAALVKQPAVKKSPAKKAAAKKPAPKKSARKTTKK